jgi:hypothetical protein
MIIFTLMCGWFAIWSLLSYCMNMLSFCANIFLPFPDEPIWTNIFIEDSKIANTFIENRKIVRRNPTWLLAINLYYCIDNADKFEGPVLQDKINLRQLIELESIKHDPIVTDDNGMVDSLAANIFSCALRSDLEAQDNTSRIRVIASASRHCAIFLDILFELLTNKNRLIVVDVLEIVLIDGNHNNNELINTFKKLEDMKLETKVIIKESNNLRDFQLGGGWGWNSNFFDCKSRKVFPRYIVHWDDEE